MNKQAFGLRIREARRKMGMSSDALSELCDCTPVSIRQIESGIRLPSLPKLISLCNALNISPNELLGPELQSPFANELPDDPRLEEILNQVRRLPMKKYDFVCTIIESLIEHIGKL